MHRALRAVGAPLAELSPVDLSTPGIVFQIGVAPRRIDILTSIDGVAFADAWPGRAEASYEGVRFPVIGIDALMNNTRAVGRPKDLLDLELLGRYRRTLP